MNILLIAGVEERYYYEAFITACKNKDVRLYLFDPSRIANPDTLDIVLDSSGKVNGLIDVLELNEESYTKVQIAISDINTAWYLRENWNSQNTVDNSMESRFIKNEIRQALNSFMSILDCNWINSVDAIDRIASNKLFQQKIATQCGLKIPDTIVSNNPDLLEKKAELTGELLLKSIGYIELSNKCNYVLYSERFSLEELSRSKIAISRCPVFAQEYIEKKYEYRVMVVGEKVLSCRIDSQASEKTRTDWRHYDFKNVEHLHIDLPTDISDKLLCFMKKVKLRYGAIDLIETPNGDFIFLEINPSGQWGWIADLTNLPIANAVADMLEKA